MPLIPGEVVLLERVLLQVEEFFDVEIGPMDVLDVLAHQRLGSGDAVLADDDGMFVIELVRQEGGSFAR